MVCRLFCVIAMEDYTADDFTDIDHFAWGLNEFNGDWKFTSNRELFEEGDDHDAKVATVSEDTLENILDILTNDINPVKIYTNDCIINVESMSDINMLTHNNGHIVTLNDQQILEAFDLEPVTKKSPIENYVESLRGVEKYDIDEETDSVILHATAAELECLGPDWSPLNIDSIEKDYQHEESDLFVLATWVGVEEENDDKSNIVFDF